MHILLILNSVKNKGRRGVLRSRQAKREKPTNFFMKVELLNSYNFFNEPIGHGGQSYQNRSEILLHSQRFIHKDNTTGKIH